MKNTPQKIYLQTGVADGTIDESISDFDQLFRSAITWSTHRIYESDIEYNLSDSNSDMSSIMSENVVNDVCLNCEGPKGFHLGVTCPECQKPFRQLKADGT